MKPFLRYFEKSGDDVIEELALKIIELLVLPEWFEVEEEIPIYDCYPVGEKAKVNLEVLINQKLDREKHEYFLSLDS